MEEETNNPIQETQMALEENNTSQPVNNNPIIFPSGFIHIEENPLPMTTEEFSLVPIIRNPISIEEQRIHDYKILKEKSSLTLSRLEPIIQEGQGAVALPLPALKMSFEEVRMQDYMTMKSLKNNTQEKLKAQVADKIYDPRKIQAKEMRNSKISINKNLWSPSDQENMPQDLNNKEDLRSKIMSISKRLQVLHIGPVSSFNSRSSMFSGMN